MRIGARAVSAALMLLAVACAPTQGEAVRLDKDVADAKGVAATRIVSLNPCVDAILAKIAPEHIVAVSHYSHNADSASMDVTLARQFRATSGSAEEVVALAPDLVIAGAFLAPATEQAMTRMGLRIVKTGSITSIGDAKAQVRAIATLAGEEAAGERLVARIDAALAAAAPPRDLKATSALVWQSGGLVPGEATLVSDLLAHTGFANFSAGRGLGQGAIVPLEDVMADPPQVLLSAGQGRMMQHPALMALSPKTQRAEFSTRLTWCGGPTIPAAAARLAEIRDGMAQ